MSSTLAPGAPALGADLWRRAEAELTQKERNQLAKAQVSTSGSSNVSLFEHTKTSLETSTQIFREHSLAIALPSSPNGTKRKVPLRDIFRRAIQWLNVVISIGDKFVQFDASGHAALPWAGVKSLVELVTSDVKKYDDVLEGVGIIVHNLTFYAEWQRLYASRPVQSDATELFQDALVQLYSAILRYQGAALHFFEQNRMMRIGKGISSTFMSSTKMQGYLEALSRAETEASRVARLLDADLMQQMSANLNSVADQLHDLKMTHDDGNTKILNKLDTNALPMQKVADYVVSRNLVEVLDWFSTAPFQATHDSIYEKVIPETGAWLLNHEKFLQWQTSSGSASLCLHGTMGMGKSSLAAIVINHLERTVKSSMPTSKMAFFYFVRDSGRTTDRSAFATIARQLAASTSTSQLLAGVEKLRNEFLAKGYLSATELSAENSRQIVLDLASQYSAVWLVFDALDESADAAQIHEAVDTIIQQCQTPIKVFWTSRESSGENPGLTELYEQYPHLSIREGIQSGDIASFVDTRMDELIKQRKLLSSVVGKDKKDVAARLRSSILSHADGMFRWAEMRLIELCGRKYLLKSKLLNALDQPPQELSDIYDSIYHALYQGGETTESRLVKAMLCWMIYSRVPIERRQLISALVIYCNAGLEEDEVNEELLQNLLPGFFTVVYFPTNGLSMFEFAHLSVREHFQGHHELSEATGHAVIALTCLRRLAIYADDFTAERLSTVVDVATWTQNIPHYLGYSMLDEASTETHNRSCGSLIIGQNYEEEFEYAARRRRRRSRQRERRLQIKLKADAGHFGDSKTLSSASSSTSSLSDRAAVLSAPYVRVYSESDVWDEPLREATEDMGGLDPSIPNEPIVRNAVDARPQDRYDETDLIPDPATVDFDVITPTWNALQPLGTFHSLRSYSVDDVLPYRSQHPLIDDFVARRPRSYSVNDGPFYQWRYGSFDPRYADLEQASHINDSPIPGDTYDAGIDVDEDSVVDYSSKESSADVSNMSLAFEGDEELGWDRYPLALEERKKWLRRLRTGEVSFEEFSYRRHDILRTPLLKYARTHWHVHLAKSPYSPTTLVYNDAELQQCFEDFCDVTTTEKVIVDSGLPFVLWYDWYRQTNDSKKNDLRAAIDKHGVCKKGPRDRWLIRLKEVCKLAGIEPGCRIAMDKAGREKTSLAAADDDN